MGSKDDKLFRLIKSMNKSEKIFFKKQSTTHRKDGDSQYLDLFDVIDKQGAYDEAKLLPKVKVNKRQLSSLKKYLFNALLRSLKAFRRDKTEKDRVDEWRGHIEILAEKGLYNEAYKLVQKAKQKAHEIDYFTAHFELLALENSFIGRVVALTQDLNNEIRSKQKSIIKTLENQHYYAWEYYEASYLSKNYQFAREKTDLEALRDKIEQPSFQALESALSHDAKLFFCYTHALYCQMIGDYEAEWRYKKMMLDVWEASPQMQEEKLAYYITTLVGFGNACYLCKKDSDLYACIQKLQAIKAQNLIQKGLMFFNINRLYCHYFESTLVFNEFDQVVQGILEGLKAYRTDDFTTHKRSLLVNLMSLAIIKSDYDLAWECYVKSGALVKTEVQKDAQYLIQLLALVVCFKQENSELIESICRSIEYKIKKEEKPFEYERIMLQLFRKLLQTPAFEYKDVYAIYLKQFEALLENPYEKQALLHYFDIITWLKAELKQVNMLDLKLLKAN